MRMVFIILLTTTVVLSPPSKPTPILGCSFILLCVIDLHCSCSRWFINYGGGLFLQAGIFNIIPGNVEENRLNRHRLDLRWEVNQICEIDTSFRVNPKVLNEWFLHS